MSSSRLIPEEIAVKVQTLLDFSPQFVFGINYKMTVDEVIAAQKVVSGSPLVGPKDKFPTAQNLIDAIKNDTPPEGFTTEDLINWMVKFESGPLHLIAARATQEGAPVGGLSRKEFEAIIQTAAIYTYNKVYGGLVTSGEEEESAIQMARQKAKEVLRGIKIPMDSRGREKFGGNWQGFQRRPGSEGIRRVALPAFISHFVEKGKRTAILQVREGLFGMFPREWKDAIFGPNNEFIEYGEDVDSDSQIKQKAENQFVSDVNKITSGMEGVKTLKGASKWLKLYTLLSFPLERLRAAFVQNSKGHVFKTKIVKNDKNVMRWATGIENLNVWFDELNKMTDGKFTRMFRYIVKGVDIVSIDPDGNIFFYANPINESQYKFGAKVPRLGVEKTAVNSKK